MIIGLSTFHSDKGFFESLAKAGIGCVEVSLPGREYAAFDNAAFAANAREAGVDVRSFHLPFYLAPEDGPVDPASLDDEVRRRTAEVHARFVPTAAEMGRVSPSSTPAWSGTPSRSARSASRAPRNRSSRSPGCGSSCSRRGRRTMTSCAGWNAGRTTM